MTFRIEAHTAKQSWRSATRVLSLGRNHEWPRRFRLSLIFTAFVFAVTPIQNMLYGERILPTSIWSWMQRHPELSEPGQLSNQILQSIPVVKKLVVGQGDTLQKLLIGAGARVNESHQAIAALSNVFNPRNLRQGQEITVTLAREGNGELKLESLSFQDSVERSLSIIRGQAGFGVEEKLFPLETVQARAAGTISESLYVSAISAGVPVSILTEMIKLFSYDVDFQREIRKGDGFEIFFERRINERGEAVREGRILSAAMILRGEETRYYFFEPSDGEADYFTMHGQSVRKALLRTPIDGARLTSGFGMRNHPILGFSMMHKGVDFAAPTGTPVQSAGDGAVAFAGERGAYGLYVIIRHNSTYSTAYAHLSRIHVRAGERVRQGDVIGAVGSTGRSTGPHLHYEVMVNNQHINPLDVRLPSGRRLEGLELVRFRETIENIEQQMAAVPPQNWLTIRN